MKISAFFLIIILIYSCSNTEIADQCDPNPCINEHQKTCRSYNGYAICLCDVGYKLDEITNTCILNDVCNPNPCTDLNKNKCIDLDGYYSCSCNEGYNLLGSQCVKIFKYVDFESTNAEIITDNDCINLNYDLKNYFDCSNDCLINKFTIKELLLEHSDLKDLKINMYLNDNSENKVLLWDVSVATETDNDADDDSENDSDILFLNRDYSEFSEFPIGNAIIKINICDTNLNEKTGILNKIHFLIKY